MVKRMRQLQEMKGTKMMTVMMKVMTTATTTMIYLGCDKDQ